VIGGQTNNHVAQDVSSWVNVVAGSIGDKLTLRDLLHAMQTS